MGDDFEIFDAVVGFETVPMMNDFAFVQWAVDMILHYLPMLHHIAAFVRPWCARRDQNLLVSRGRPLDAALPVRVRRAVAVRRIWQMPPPFAMGQFDRTTLAARPA